MREPHLVPLSRQAVALLRAAQKLTRGRHDEMTAHGFRTTASNLVAELGFGSDAIELQLAHSLPGRYTGGGAGATFATGNPASVQDAMLDFPG